MKGITATICAGMLCIGVVRVSRGEPAEARLSVRGALRVQPTQSGDVVMIRVEDEAGSPVAGAEVIVQGIEVSACGARPRDRTGADGNVCFRVPSPEPERALLIASKLHFATAQLELDLRAKQAPIEVLVWPRLVDLDRDERHSIELGPVPEGILQLTLSCDGKGRELYGVRSEASSRLRLELETDSFRGSFGLCQLSGSARGFPGHAVPLTLRADTRLELERVGTVGADRIEATIEVQSSVGPVEGGVVEARRAGIPRATASVRTGRATLRFASRDAGQSVVVSYLSSSPVLKSGPPISIILPRLAAGHSSRLWLSLPLLAFGVWLWSRLRRSRPTRPKSALSAKLKPRTSPQRAPLEQHLHGIVFDVDTQERIDGADVVLTRIEATRRTSVFRTQSGQDGVFTIPEPWRGQVDLEISCESAGYGRQQFRPEGATVRLGMVAEQRVLLRTLVRWAKASGWWAPGAALPTPLELASRAAHAGRKDVEVWAQGVNARVYGARLPGTGGVETAPDLPAFDALR